jgi:SNF2 family DNA or RNA helicase
VYTIWRHLLDDLGVAMYTGSETPAQKAEAKEAFLSGRARVLILSLRSGVGLDGLQQAGKTIVFGELDWSPGVHEQCIGRLRRDGQEGQVTAFYLVSDDGSDPFIAGMLGLKTSQSQRLLDAEDSGLTKLQSQSGTRVKDMARQYLSAREQLTI